LGVTPALLAAPWPAGSALHAVDYDEVMIELLWRESTGRHVHHARWQSLPFEDGTFDLVVGDCSFNALPGVAAYADVLREVARVSRPGAPLVARFFSQGDPRLTVAGLLDEFAGEVAGLNAVEARLLLAIAAADDDGAMHFSDVPKRIMAEWGEVDDYLTELGHSPAEIERAHNVFATDQALNYPSQSQIERAFAPFYAQAEFVRPSYGVGAYCPTVRFS
jgi:SAM-dependent methyltransferase